MTGTVGIVNKVSIFMVAYDAVVIGAGNAGLTAATTLQRGGMHTLLVERHNIPGGCATSFRRGRFAARSSRGSAAHCASIRC